MDKLRSFFADLLKFWLDIVTIMRFENFMHFWEIFFVLRIIHMICNLKTYNLFRTITNCTDRSDPGLEKCVKSSEKNGKLHLHYIILTDVCNQYKAQENEKKKQSSVA